MRNVDLQSELRTACVPVKERNGRGGVLAVIQAVDFKATDGDCLTEEVSFCARRIHHTAEDGCDGHRCKPMPILVGKEQLLGGTVLRTRVRRLMGRRSG